MSFWSDDEGPRMPIFLLLKKGKSDTQAPHDRKVKNQFLLNTRTRKDVGRYSWSGTGRQVELPGIKQQRRGQGQAELPPGEQTGGKKTPESHRTLWQQVAWICDLTPVVDGRWMVPRCGWRALRWGQGKVLRWRTCSLPLTSTSSEDEKVLIFLLQQLEKEPVSWRKILHSVRRAVVEKSCSRAFVLVYFTRTSSEGPSLSAGCFQGFTASWANWSQQSEGQLALLMHEKDQKQHHKYWALRLQTHICSQFYEAFWKFKVFWYKV